MKWIKTEDQKPKKDELVIVTYMGEATVGKLIGSGIRAGKWAVMDGIGSRDPIDYGYKPTEWMPLPKVK